MKCKVYRSLDRSNVFFGIRGRFVRIFGIIGAGVGAVALVLGMALSSIVGVVAFLGGAAVDYMFVLSLQGKETDRQYAIRNQSKKLPLCFQVPAMCFRHLWRGDRFGV